MSREQIRVAVVEDVPLFRRLLEDILEGDERTTLVATAASAKQARTVVPASGATVLLLDLHLPDESGFLLGLELRRLLPGLRVVVLSEHVRPDVLSSLEPADQPYWSYVLKGSITSPEHLISTVLASGLRPIIDDQVRPSATIRELGLELLSERQQEILSLVASGLSNQAIAEKLHLSAKSVEYHLTQVYAQLGLLDSKDHNSRVRASLLFNSAAKPEG